MWLALARWVVGGWVVKQRICRNIYKAVTINSKRYDVLRKGWLMLNITSCYTRIPQNIHGGPLRLPKSALTHHFKGVPSNTPSAKVLDIVTVTHCPPKRSLFIKFTIFVCESLMRCCTLANCFGAIESAVLVFYCQSYVAYELPWQC